MARGFTPDSGAAWLLPRLIGMVRTRQLLMLGEEISGATAAELGHHPRRAHRQPTSTAAADALVTRLAEAPTVALGLTKWLLHDRQRTRPRPPSPERGPGARAVQSQRGLPRGPGRVQEKRDAKFQGPMSTLTDHRDTTARRCRRGRRAVGATRGARRLAGGRRRGPAALRAVRSPDDYRQWYPTFAPSGLVVPTWQPEHGGLGSAMTSPARSRPCSRPLRLHRLNPLGLNNAAAALFSHGTEEQRRRFLPPIVRNEEKWCQLFSEPGAGSDLASLATRAVRDGDDWVITGQKVWTTWADEADFAILLARTDPDQPKHQGITYFLLDMHQPGVEVRPLRQITGEAEFNEVFLDGARVPDAHRVGDVNDGWRVSASTLSSERQMVSGSGSGGMGRLGGSSAERLITLAQETGRWDDPVVRNKVMRLWAQEQIRGWTNARVRAALSAGQSPGAASSIGKVHQATLEPADPGSDGRPARARRRSAWPRHRRLRTSLPREVQGMMRSLANGDRGRHHRHQQEHPRRAGAGPAPRARPLEGQALEGHSAIVSDYERLVVREAGRCRLADPRPAGCRQRLRRADARRARGGVGRTRRRPRRSRDRQHRQRHGVLHRAWTSSRSRGTRRPCGSTPAAPGTPS